jgi:hypothetical protein
VDASGSEVGVELGDEPGQLRFEETELALEVEGDAGQCVRPGPEVRVEAIEVGNRARVVATRDVDAE